MSSAILTKSGFNVVLPQCFGTDNNGQFQCFVIGTNSTAAATTDTGLAGTITGWTSTGSDTKSFTSITFDETNQKVTLRGFVSAGEATNAVITEYADLNLSSPKVPAGRFTWTDAVTKTTSNQLTTLTVYKRL